LPCFVSSNFILWDATPADSRTVAAQAIKAPRQCQGAFIKGRASQV
jgi:hypothetical protein